MEKHNTYLDLVKRELESFTRYALVALVAVITFFLYIVERESNGNWVAEELPKISVFGLQFEHAQFAYAIFLIPVLQLVLLRPLQGIKDLISDKQDRSNACELLLMKNLSVFNPFHTTEMSSGASVYWLSWIFNSMVIVFFPSVSLMIWLSEVFDQDFVLSTTIFSLIILFFLYLQARVLCQIWSMLFGFKEMIIRFSVLFIVFVAVGPSVYAIIT